MASMKNKKIILLLLLLILAALAYFGWNSMNEQKSNPTADEPKVTVPAPLGTTDDSHIGEEDHDDHAHDKTAETPTFDKAAKGTVYNLPESPLVGVRAVGDPNAPIVIQEFFSLTCNHCAEFHNNVFADLKSKYIDTGKVYFIFEEFPLNGPALYGSKIARCLPEERYTGFISMLFKTQDKWAFSGNFKESLKQNAMLAGMSENDFNRCFDDKELQKAIGERLQLASDNYKVKSTPSFVINYGERALRGSQPIQSFDAVIEELMADSSKPDSSFMEADVSNN